MAINIHRWLRMVWIHSMGVPIFITTGFYTSVVFWSRISCRFIPLCFVVCSIHGTGNDVCFHVNHLPATGHSVSVSPEIPLGCLMGLWGSAFSASIAEVMRNVGHRSPALSVLLNGRRCLLLAYLFAFVTNMSALVVFVCLEDYMTIFGWYV